MSEVSRFKRNSRYVVIAVVAASCGFAALAISMTKSGDAAFPGVNGRIAYSYGDAYSGSIWSANPDGTSPARLTNGTNDYSPAYSANGSRIAFSREGGIYVMNADGTSLTQIDAGSSSQNVETEWRENYKNPKEPSEIIPFVKIQTFKSTWHYFNSPSFSPDGSQLAVGEGSGQSIEQSICAVEEEEGQVCIGYEDPDSYNDYNYECVACVTHIVTVNSISGAQTSEVTPPTSVNEDYEPAYSSSGKIAFTRWVSGAGSQIFVVNSPGAAPSQVTAGPNDYSPDFSPDGSQIVFDRGSGELGVVGASGGAVRLLSVPSGAGKSRLGSPAFSPDGTRITFERTFIPSGGKAEFGVYTMGVDGAGVTKIVDHAFTPNWQPVQPPAPPVPALVKTQKGKVKLNKKHEAVIGTIVCGSSPCTLRVLSALLKVSQPKSIGKKHGSGKTSTASKATKSGGKVYAVKITVPKTLAPGKKTMVKATVAGKALAALDRAGKGTLTVKVRVTEGLGNKVVTMKSTLKPSPARKHGAKKSR